MSTALWNSYFGSFRLADCLGGDPEQFLKQAKQRFEPKYGEGNRKTEGKKLFISQLKLWTFFADLQLVAYICI